MNSTAKQARLEERRYKEAQPEFPERYRMRSGIEAANAQLKKLMPGSRLQVRGLKAVRFAATLKALGVNIQRAAHWAKKQKSAAKKVNSALWPGRVREAMSRRNVLSLLFHQAGGSDAPVAPAIDRILLFAI